MATGAAGMLIFLFLAGFPTQFLDLVFQPNFGLFIYLDRSSLVYLQISANQLDFELFTSQFFPF